MQEKNFRLISVLMENQPGALSRLTGLFSARNFNIESLTVAPTADPTLSRTTLSTYLTDNMVIQLVKQLNRLVDVVKVVNISDANHIERDMLIIKLDASNYKYRSLILELVGIFSAKVVDVSEETYIVELSASVPKLNSFINAIGDELILEMVRTGPLGLIRGHRYIGVNRL